MSEAQAIGRGLRVEIWTDKYRVVGHVFVPYGIGGGSARLSDIINDPHRTFVSVTRVTVYRRGEEQVLGQHEFILLNRGSIEIMRPLE